MFVASPREATLLQIPSESASQEHKQVSSNLTTSKWKDSYCNKNLQVKKKHTKLLYDIKLNTPFCLFHEVMDIFFYRCDNKTEPKRYHPFEWSKQQDKECIWAILRHFK